jgi:AAA domain/IclR helix-turn-helix domain
MVAERLVSVAREVRIVELPDLPHKGAVADWLEAGNDPGGLIDLCKSFPVYDPSRPPSQLRGPTIRTAHDLHGMRFAELSFVVPKYLVAGVTLFAGNPKIGKSWLCLDIALSVARGAECLGGPECEQGDVLYLALEDNERRLQKRIQKLLPAFTSGWPRGFHYATEWPSADNGGLDAIREWVRTADKPRLVIIDVFAMFRRGPRAGENMYLEDYKAVKGLQALALELNIAILIVHHTRKGREDSDPFEKVSGTMGLSGGADTTMILSRDTNGTTLYCRGRDIEEIETAFEFDRDACLWRALGDAAEVRRTDERVEILATLAEAGEPMSPADIAASVGKNAANVRQLLVKMTRSGEVKRCARGRYAHPDVSIRDVPPHDHNDHNDHIDHIDHIDHNEYRCAKEGYEE